MKVLLIEDRERRKEQFLEMSKINLDRYRFLIQATADEYNLIKAKLKGNETSLLGFYDLIITHKSAFTINEQDLLNSVGRPVVYFSGGVSQSFYTNYPVPCLHINSKDFYGPNLIEFLNYIEKYNIIELLILQFGHNWKLNLLLCTRDNFSQLLYKNHNNDLYPEDFDLIFNEKVIAIIESMQLKYRIEEVKKTGIRKRELRHINEIKSELNLEIQRAIKTKL